MPDPRFHFRGTQLSGICELKDKYSGETAAIWCSGPTFADYDDALVPSHFQRFAINETIRTHADKADWWVLSDQPIVDHFSQYCPEHVKILAMHRSSVEIHRRARAKQIWTVNSKDDPRDYGNGYEFYSRRTVAIGAVEMARFMGFRRAFLFGLDLFRLRASYYYDGANAISMSERRSGLQYVVRGGLQHKGQRIYQTPALRAARDALARVRKFGLWDEIDVFCVGSPNSQQESVPKISLEEFRSIVEREGEQEQEPAVSEQELTPTTDDQPEDLNEEEVARVAP